MSQKLTVCFPKVQFNKQVLAQPSLFLGPQSSLLGLFSLLDQRSQDLGNCNSPASLSKPASRETVDVICSLLSALS